MNKINYNYFTSNKLVNEEKQAFNLCVVAYTILWHSNKLQAQLAGKNISSVSMHNVYTVTCNNFIT